MPTISPLADPYLVTVGPTIAVRFFSESVADCNVLLEDKQNTALLVEGVGAKFGRNEALDMRFDHGFNQKKLCGDGDRSKD